MSDQDQSPQRVAFFGFLPTPLDLTVRALKSGSWGVVSVTPTIAGQAFNVIMSGFEAGDFDATEAQWLHIVPCSHEAAAPYNITPITEGFAIDFGSVMTRAITIEVKRFIGGT